MKECFTSQLQTESPPFDSQPFPSPKGDTRAGFGSPFRGRRGLRYLAIRKVNLIYAIVTLMSCATTTQAQSLAQTRCDNFHKGVNLSNWLEGYWVPNWPDTTTYTFPFFAEMKKAGIESFRMPVCFELVTDTAAPYTVDTTNRVFRVIDSVVKWTTQLDMKLIIDNQHQWNITEATWQQQAPRLAHLWAVLANHYQNLDPNRYFFEILNEPAGIQNNSLGELFTPIIDTIRQYAPNHTIIVSPNQYSNGIGYAGYQALPDTNLIYAFHSYDPFQFTHQGLTFVVPPLPTGIPFPNSGYDIFLEAEWNTAMLWKDTSHLPMFLGEFGVGDSADAQSRCNWVDTMAHRIKENNLSAFYWDVVGDFKWYHSGVATQDSIFPCFASALGLYGDTLTSVRNIAEDLAIKVFPNPAQSLLTIQTAAGLTSARYAIMNSLGETWQTGNLNAVTTEVNVGNLASGIYFLQMRNDTGIINCKFIISR